MTSTVRVNAGIAGNLNTGKNSRNLHPDEIVAAVLVPYNYSYAIAASDTDATIIAGIKASLLAAGINNAYASRSQFIGPFESLNDKTTDATYQTFGYGRMVLTDMGKYIFEFEYIDGGFEYHQKVMSLIGQVNTYKVILIGNRGCIYGTKVLDTNSFCTGIKGLTLDQFDPIKWKLANKDKSAEFKCVIGLKSVDEFNSGACIIETGQDVLGYLKDNNVQDVLLTSTGNGTAGVYTINVSLDSLRVNLATGPGALALTAACFKCVRQSTGNVITISSIAVVGQNVAITVDTADPDYSAGANVIFSLQSVSAVYAIVGGYYEAQTGGLVMHD